MWQEFNAQLLDAVIAPVIKQEFAPGMSEESLDDMPRDFLWLIKTLSEYCISINPPLSAGLWNTGNTLIYLSRDGQIEKMKDKELLRHYRALTTTAVLQYADGGSNIYTGPGNAKKEDLEKWLSKAIDDIAKLASWDEANDAY